jgi:O-antigen/teichoic acid export membrane protein
VGDEYAYLAPLVVLLTAHLAVNTSVKPLFTINVAHNRVRIPGLITILLGIINLVLSIAIPLMTGWGYYGVAVAGVIVLTFRHALFVPWYAARVLKIQMITYFKSFVPGAVAMLFIAGTAAGIATLSPLPSLSALIIAGTVITLAYGAIVLRFGLAPFEKQLFELYLSQKLKRVHRIIGSDNKD